MEIDRVKTPGRSSLDYLKCSHFRVKHLAISGKYFVFQSFSRCCQSTVITMTHWSCTKKRIKQGHFEPIQKEMKHGKKTHYFYRCFVSCSSCSVGVRQLHAPCHTSESSLEPLPCTSQLPVAAARACQHLGRLSIPKFGMDVSICTLGPLLIPSKSCCFSLVFCSLLKAEMSELVLPFPRCRAGLLKAPCSDSCLVYNTAAAWPRSSLKKLSYSGQKTPEPQINLWVNCSHCISHN